MNSDGVRFARGTKIEVRTARVQAFISHTIDRLVAAVAVSIVPNVGG